MSILSMTSSILAFSDSGVDGRTTWALWAKATMARVSSGLSFWMAAMAASWMRLSRLMPVPSSSYMEPLTSRTRARLRPSGLPPPPPAGMSLTSA